MFKTSNTDVVILAAWRSVSRPQSCLANTGRRANNSDNKADTNADILASTRTADDAFFVVVVAAGPVVVAPRSYVTAVPYTHCCGN